MNAAIIGPGRIGCGLAGELLAASGYKLVFLARNRELVNNFNRTGKYRVRLTSSDAQREIVVRGVTAVAIDDRELATSALANADVIATSVGPGNLQHIAPLIAAGLARRSRPTNVLAFENLMNAGPCLRRLVNKSLPRDCPIDRHGFSGALVARAVTQRIGDLKKDEPITFLGDMPTEFVVHGPALRSPVPRIKGMIAVDNYASWALRKLYVFSAGHATTAYLGALKGYHYIHAAIRDPEIRAIVIEAMSQGQKGIAARFGEEFAGGSEHLREILSRFENPARKDPVGRVGRDPRRKLGSNERLVGAAKLAERAGILPDKLALATAAAFCFSNPADPSCGELRKSVNNTGLDMALREICGLDGDDVFRRYVTEFCAQFEPSQRGNLLLSLDRRMWAWS